MRCLLKQLAVLVVLLSSVVATAQTPTPTPTATPIQCCVCTGAGCPESPLCVSGPTSVQDCGNYCIGLGNPCSIIEWASGITCESGCLGFVSTATPTPTQTPTPTFFTGCCQHVDPLACGPPILGVNCFPNTPLPGLVCDGATGSCITPTMTPTGPTPTETVTPTITETPTITPTGTVTGTETETPTAGPTNTITQTATVTPSITPLPPGYCCQQTTPRACAPPLPGVNCGVNTPVANALCVDGSCSTPTPTPTATDFCCDCTNFPLCAQGSCAVVCPDGTPPVPHAGEICVGSVGGSVQTLNCATPTPGVSATATPSATVTRTVTPIPPFMFTPTATRTADPLLDCCDCLEVCTSVVGGSCPEGCTLVRNACCDC